MIGDTGMGILKLLTCGCCGVLTIIDWFTTVSYTHLDVYKRQLLRARVAASECYRLVEEYGPACYTRQPDGNLLLEICLLYTSLSR